MYNNNSQLRDWVRNLLRERDITIHELAEAACIPYNTLITVLGGRDRLSKRNLMKLVRGLVWLGCINSHAGVGKMMEILRLCPGYQLDAGEADDVRRAGHEALADLGKVDLISEFMAVVDKGYRLVKGSTLGDATLLQRELERRGGRFEPMRYVVKKWLEM
jgi:hypothetical protein